MPETRYSVYRSGRVHGASAGEVALLRRRRGRFDLWIDLERREASERRRGEIDLFRKRMLGRLLWFLVAHAGRGFTPTELFEAVWETDCRGFTDFRVIKTSISRLRAMLEGRRPWRYVRKTDPAFFGRSGEYFFERSSRYCLIVPSSIAPFPPGRAGPGRDAILGRHAR